MYHKLIKTDSIKKSEDCWCAVIGKITDSATRSYWSHEGTSRFSHNLQQSTFAGDGCPFCFLVKGQNETCHFWWTCGIESGKRKVECLMVKLDK